MAAEMARTLQKEAARLQIREKADSLVERLGRHEVLYTFASGHDVNGVILRSDGFTIKKDHALIWIEVGERVVFSSFQSNFNTDGSPKTETYFKGSWTDALNKLFKEEQQKKRNEDSNKEESSLLRRFGIM